EPMGKAENKKSPLPLLLAVCLIPLSALLTLTCAFGIAAPDGSATVPVIEAVSCASREVERVKANRREQSQLRRDLIVDSSLLRRFSRSHPEIELPTSRCGAGHNSA